MSQNIEEILKLLLWIAPLLATPLLVRIIRVQRQKIKKQKREIDRLTIHIQVLTEYIVEASRRRPTEGTIGQKRPARRIKKAG